MASPQTENGYVKIANEIMDALIFSDWAGQDFKIAFLILRKTYGFNKTEDAVSLSQMKKATGMSTIRCSQVVNRLQLRKILTVTENINGIGKKYKFNKNFEQWEAIKKNINPYKKTKETLKKKRKRPLRKSESTKDTLTKDTLTKDKKETYKEKEIILPEWLDKKVWNDFVEFRISTKAGMTKRAKELAIRELMGFYKQGESPTAIIEQSILRGWKGLFPVKKESYGSRNFESSRKIGKETGRARSDDQPYPVDETF